MDPLTHIVVGIALSTVSGTPMTPANPVFTAAAIGAFAPDLDLVCSLKGEISYLYQHRGASHSALGVLLLAGLTALALSPFYLDAAFGQLFFWALAGAASHIALDYFNPHGIRFLWPVKKTRFHWSLLNGIDPILLVLSLFCIIGYKYSLTNSRTWLWCFSAYIILRWIMSINVYFFLKRQFHDDSIKKIIVMPSLFSLWSWDFLVDNTKSIIAGEASLLPRTLSIKRILRKSADRIVRAALTNTIGKKFSDFTPYVYVSLVRKENNEIVLEFLDLRYRIKDNFLHSAIAVFNEDEELKKAFFCPFNKKRQITLES